MADRLSFAPLKTMYGACSEATSNKKAKRSNKKTKHKARQARKAPHDRTMCKQADNSVLPTCWMLDRGTNPVPMSQYLVVTCNVTESVIDSVKSGRGGLAEILVLVGDGIPPAATFHRRC